MGPVRELRVAVTAEDYEKALHFYRDALGLPMIESWENEGGSGALLDAGRATLEVLSRSQTDLITKGFHSQAFLLVCMHVFSNT